MRPKSTPRRQSVGDLFRARLEQILDHEHELYRLAGAIRWEAFDEAFGALYVENKGRPGLPTRLMVGVHYLKHAFDESDESVVERLLENPYWQDFCGFEYFQHRMPLDPSSLVRWRKRVGPEKMEKLLAQTVATAQRGVYEAGARGLSAERLHRHFLRGKGANEGFIRVKPELARLIEFRPFNLMSRAWSLGEPFDFIFCRNVMIYFDAPTQRQVLQQMHRVLKPGGLLYVGHSENFTDSRELFRLRGKTIYQKV